MLDLMTRSRVNYRFHDFGKTAQILTRSQKKGRLLKIIAKLKSE